MYPGSMRLEDVLTVLDAQRLARAFGFGSGEDR